MKYKVFTKAMKVLIVGTLIIMAFTKGNITDWLIIGLTAGWLIFMTAYLIYKSGKREPLDDLHDEDSDVEDFGEDTEDSNDMLDPILDLSEAETWYRMIGCQILTESIIDLNTRGIKKLEIEENGDVIVADSMFVNISTLPDKSCWDRIVELLREDGLTAFASFDKILISW